MTEQTNNQFARTKMILGEKALERLFSARVAVFGIGGVGGYVVEALARSGVGALDLIDSDVVSVTNINRQIYALHSTLGKNKVDVAKERVLDINPACSVNAHKVFYLPENADKFDFSLYDYVVDAVDTVTAKLEIITCAKKCNVPVISAMGAGNKLDAALFEVADIYETSVCPLAKVMRKELKSRGISSLKVVYSKEKPIRPQTDAEVSTEEKQNKRAVPGSVAFAPAAAGFIIAGEVVKDLIEHL